ncbi:MAG: riboflavin biosynthesis protein RibF [Limosilactobacillus sp.]|uniref:riboflavin biosynthesis protein RibF n=1 Tax=Limosilactobacillus sp. TaxID=2773925 RepID=UPI0026FE8E06|nr:riboflavin biosynthesis protein RibF [Limosilactobacillus sp.]
MQQVKLTYPLNKDQIPDGPVVLAMGFFDGVHRGHKAVINTALKIARERQLPLAILTYSHAPGIVYHQYKAGFKYLTPAPRKAAIMHELGADIVYMVSFTSAYASQEPQDFVDNFLMALHPEVVVAGFDHTYGKKDVATMERLPEYAKGRFEVVTVPKLTVEDGDGKVSSTYVRECLTNHKIEEANEALGYTYTTTGLVVHGFARGRTLGLPTANIDTPETEIVPPIGVYVTEVKIQGKWYGGMASVGYNVTFGKADEPTVEIYLFDFDQMIYGEEVSVRWYKYLRGEIKFDSADALVDQMKQDEKDARAFLAQK